MKAENWVNEFNSGKALDTNSTTLGSAEQFTTPKMDVNQNLFS
jgi:hypothetical protein